MEEEEKKAEIAREVAEKEEMETQERVREMERKREEITVAKCKLAPQRKALLKVERAIDDIDDNDINNDVRSQSLVSKNTVSGQIDMFCTVLTWNSIR